MFYLILQSIGLFTLQLGRSWRGILVWGCLCVCPCMHPCVRAWHFLMHAISYEPCMLKFWNFIISIPHGKIADTRLFSCASYLPFLSYAPLKELEWNLTHSISYEPCMLGFSISYMDSSWKNSWHTSFFLSELSPFLVLASVCPFVTLFDACHILWTMHARVLKFHISDSSWKNSGHASFFLSELSPFLELWPFDKIRLKSSYEPCMLVLKFHVWIPHGKIADQYFYTPSKKGVLAGYTVFSMSVISSFRNSVNI